MLHFKGDLLGWGKAVEHLLEGCRQGVQADLDPRLRDHLRLEQAGEAEPTSRVPPHQRLGQLLEAFVLGQTALDGLFPGLQVVFLGRGRLWHQAGRLDLHQTGADDQERRQAIEWRTFPLDGAQVIVCQGRQLDRFQVDLGTLGQAEQQLDRTVEGGTADQVDRILLELDVSRQFRLSARRSRRVTSSSGCSA